MTKAMVMAAGLGTRMRPLTDAIPKPLVSVAGRTLIDRALDWLAASGVDEAIVNSHYKAEILEAELAKRSNLPRIVISREHELLETGGGVKQALPLLGNEPFFVINSDVICIDGPTPALKRLLAHWDDATMDVLLLLQPTDKTVGYDGKGDFFLEDGKLRRINSPSLTLPRKREREFLVPSPACGGGLGRGPLVFTGVQLLHPRIFHNAPTGAFSLNVLYNQALALGRLGALMHDGHWLHIGDPEGIKAAEKWLKYNPLPQAGEARLP